jgi:hypothetical protein
MLKVLSFLKRRPDFTRESFSRYWRTTHKAHALKLVEAGFIKGYIQNHPAEHELPGLEVMADGSPELWVEDAGALGRLVSSPEYLQGAGPDEANFMVPPAVSCLAKERVVCEAVAPGSLQQALKLMLLFQRVPEDPADEHPWLMPDSQPLRLTRHAVVAGEIPALFAGVECTWWSDIETLRQAWDQRRQESPAASVRGLLVREEIVVAPPLPI